VEVIKMKKTLAFVLTFVMVLTMSAGMTLTAKAAEIFTVTTSKEYQAALDVVQPGDTIRLSGGFYSQIGQGFPSPFIPTGVTLIMSAGTTFGTNGGNTSGTRVTMVNNGTMIVEAGAIYELQRISTLENNGVIHFMEGSKYHSGTYTSSSIIVNNNGSLYIDEGVTLTGNFLNPLKNAESPEEPDLCEVCGYLRTHCICPDAEPEPLTSIDGDASIIITRSDPILPILLDPESDKAVELFGENIAGGTGFNFGSHKYTAEPQAIDSLNNLSMIYGYNELPQFKETFTVTCSISDFLLEDNTPIFNDFSLLMRRMNFYADREDYPVVGEASFELAKDESVVVVKTDELGYALTNYNSVLTLEANTTANIGAANATITWEIAPEVI
jgi:hypothetical protein